MKINFTLLRKSLKSNFLNFFGSIFLLFSFIIQNFLFNKWDEQLNSFLKANEQFTELTTISLKYQSLYLLLENQDESIKNKFQPVFIYAAAEKYRLGKIISTNLNLFANESEKKEFAQITNDLLKQTYSVKNLNTLYDFVSYVDSKIPQNIEVNKNWMSKLNRKKKVASVIFLGFQIVGSIMIAFAYLRK
ncbi:hypothetical protein [Capnocytophaga stomatis]|uniref:hypothetical protein n=1 Tax=Capnocytophaga stomatis TaxID=1848904 RepID=UPI001AD3FE0F|nr:hypothetical protein [Capnocytophaga stomatis]GIM50661.1 hypothetical protein CAPN003_21130 [Capnocytophaga stomatis]